MTLLGEILFVLASIAAVVMIAWILAVGVESGVKAHQDEGGRSDGGHNSTLGNH